MNKEDNKEKNKLFYVILMFGGFLCLVPTMGIKMSLGILGVSMILTGVVIQLINHLKDLKD